MSDASLFIDPFKDDGKNLMLPLEHPNFDKVIDNHRGLKIDWDRMRGPYQTKAPRSDLIWAAVDLDGTLAEGIWTPDNPTSEIGYPIWRNVEKVRKLEAAGYKIIIHTSRAWTDHDNIEGWLNHYNIPHRRIVCGKLLAVIYIDDRGRHADDESWLPERNPHE